MAARDKGAVGGGSRQRLRGAGRRETAGGLAATALAGELCAVLDAGAEGLIVYLPGTCVFDSARLDTLMRVARRARGWGTWLRLVIPDAGVRRMVRLVALNQVMPVHASVTAAIGAAASEAAGLVGS